MMWCEFLDEGKSVNNNTTFTEETLPQDSVRHSTRKRRLAIKHPTYITEFETTVLTRRMPERNKEISGLEEAAKWSSCWWNSVFEKNEV